LKQIDFDTWKAEYEPRVYEDSGAYCFDHEEQNLSDPENWCDCEFLYTYTLPELTDENWEDEDWMETKAIQEKRIWTWDNEGIRSGVTNERSELLITKKPWAEKMEVI
jgi:hypothetical protein